ncbi:MAG: ECF transporter S component [Spirochaetales bacterium]|nr:ECF transporter S component [Spirochaetales bacterium]
MKNSLDLRKITVAGVLSAVAVVLGITPFGIIPWFSGASITIMHVPVIIAAILEGPIVGMIVGLIFGVSSLIKAAVQPLGILDPYFTNPLVSVLPRILIGLVTWAIYRGIKRWELPAVIIASVLGSLTNTILVVGSLGLFANINWEEMLGISYWPLFGTIFVANGVPEAIGAALITTAVVVAWKRLDRGKKSSNLADISDEETE